MFEGKTDGTGDLGLDPAEGIQTDMMKRGDRFVRVREGR